MLDYTGIKCPVCGVPFREGDDIVVCPECGAPYHRACYQKEGHCIFPELHEQGREWQPPAPPRAPDVSAEIKDRECPVCGLLNSHSALFCSRCGSSLLGDPQTHANTPPQQQPRQGTQNGVPPFNPTPAPPRTGGYSGMPGMPFAADPMGGASPADVLDEGVTFGDASQLVRQNSGYYMAVFRYMKQTGRNKFNFCAFLFSGAWMLYRKQYKWGAVVLSLMSLLYIGYLFTSIFVSTPLLLDLMTRSGIDINQSLSGSSEQILLLSDQLAREPVLTQLLMFLPLLCLAGMLVIMIVVGMRGNRMYLKHCVQTVRRVKAAQGDGDPDMTLAAKGGVNVAVAVCIGACYFILTNFLPLFL